MIKQETISRFRSAIENRHQYARQWKERTGGKVLGYFCCYFPEELAYAAGVLPVRIVSNHEPQELSNMHIPGFFCSFCRDALAEGLKGTYEYLDGIAMAHTCRQIAQAYESWLRHVPVDYHYYLPMPALADSDFFRPWVVEELGEFQGSLENWTGNKVSPSALENAIELYNTGRRHLMSLYEMRKAETPPISGGETMEVVLSSMFCDKVEHNQWLQNVLANISVGDPAQRRPRTRFMLVGGEDHDPELPHLIEAQGADIVIDDMCMGSRYFWNLVPDGKDPLAALATRYLEKPSCPVKDISATMDRARQKHLLNLARDYGVEGVIMVYQKFCDPQELDMPFLIQTFKEAGIPTCVLELETTLARGQVQTRVQAFLETIELE
ncbi:MAG: 2-hydroxyacyl-CoA dehydratase [Dehalococcoidia bacterium]